jgi:hypothetical protein
MSRRVTVKSIAGPASAMTAARLAHLRASSSVDRSASGLFSVTVRSFSRGRPKASSPWP